MKNQRLIKALLASALRIEMHFYVYYWANVESCNCGILAYVLLTMAAPKFRKISVSKFRDKILGEVPGISIWADSSNEEYFTCPITELPGNHIFRVLRHAGLKYSDIYALENLSSNLIRHIAGLCTVSMANDARAQGYSDRDDPKAVIKYMRAWAGLLQKEERETKID